VGLQAILDRMQHVTCGVTPQFAATLNSHVQVVALVVLQRHQRRRHGLEQLLVCICKLSVCVDGMRLQELQQVSG